MVTNPTRNHTTIRHQVSFAYNDVVNQSLCVWCNSCRFLDELGQLICHQYPFKCLVSLSKLSRKLQFVSPSINSTLIFKLNRPNQTLQLIKVLNKLETNAGRSEAASPHSHHSNRRLLPRDFFHFFSQTAGAPRPPRPLQHNTEKSPAADTRLHLLKAPPPPVPKLYLSNLTTPGCKFLFQDIPVH